MEKFKKIIKLELSKIIFMLFFIAVVMAITRYLAIYSKEYFMYFNSIFYFPVKFIIGILRGACVLVTPESLNNKICYNQYSIINILYFLLNIFYYYIISCFLYVGIKKINSPK